jgi:hypothetical protein
MACPAGCLRLPCWAGRRVAGDQRRPCAVLIVLYLYSMGWAASCSASINTRTPDLILDLAVAAGGVAERKDDHKLLHHRPSAGWLLASWGSYPTASAPSILRRPPAMAYVRPACLACPLPAPRARAPNAIPKSHLLGSTYYGVSSSLFWIENTVPSVAILCMGRV